MEIKNIYQFYLCSKDFLDSVRETHFVLMEKLPNSYPNRFYFSTLSKILNSLTAVNQLIGLSQNDLNYFSSIEILLRSCLMDYITFHYIVQTQKVEEGTHILLDNKSIYELFSSQIEKIIHEIKKIQSMGGYSKENMQQEFNDLNKLSHFFTGLIDSGGRYELKFNRQSSIDHFMKFLKTNKKVIEAYKLFYFYSKIEHQGYFTLAIQNRIFSPAENNQIFQDLQFCYNLLTWCLIELLIIFHVDKIKIDYLASMRERILEVELQIIEN